MQEESGITAIAHIIQLSVAPVFLLTGIGTLLSVMTNRLGRVVDRTRVLKSKVVPGHVNPSTETELAILSRRARLVSIAITLCTITALLICGVIAILFLGNTLKVDIHGSVVLLFISAMATLFGGLVMFLIEVLTAAGRLNFDAD